MGTLWGATSPVTCHSPTIYADIALEPGGAIPIDAEAEERGLYRRRRRGHRSTASRSSR